MRTLKRKKTKKVKVEILQVGEGCLGFCSESFQIPFLLKPSCCCRLTENKSLRCHFSERISHCSWWLQKHKKRGSAQQSFLEKDWSSFYCCGELCLRRLSSGTLAPVFHLPDRRERACLSWAPILPPECGDSGFPPPFPNARCVNLFWAPIQMSAAVFFL